MRASSRPSSTARISACMLLPRPEIKMPIEPPVRTTGGLPVSDTGAFLDFSDAHGIALAGSGQHIDHGIRSVRTTDHNQADPHVEGAPHVLVRDAPLALEPLKERRNLPGLAIDRRSSPFRQDAREVVRDAS